MTEKEEMAFWERCGRTAFFAGLTQQDMPKNIRGIHKHAWLSGWIDAYQAKLAMTGRNAI